LEIRSHAITEVRKGGRLMSKGPDLSEFPIPRKGGAKPIAMDEATETAVAEGQRGGEESTVPRVPPAPPPSPGAAKSVTPQASRVVVSQGSMPAPSGQIVATTVKLDENRYLRLADAGKPGPGRLKRRTIQEMVIEALDEWFERRGL
jgi:hypothetical protein